VLVRMQEHVHGLHGDLAHAVGAIDRLQGAPDLPHHVRQHLRVASAALASAIANVGDIQILLAAAAQSLLARDAADQTWEDSPDRQ
jgi:hypothetical protein